MKIQGLRRIAAGIAAASVLLFAGCSKQESDTIKIGGIFPLSGSVAVYGVTCRQAIDLAIEEINAAGGINGKMVEMIVEDDEGNPEKSVNAYKKLTTKDRVNMIIGSMTSGCCNAIASLAQNQKVVMIAPAATATEITQVGDYIFRTCFIDPFQGTVGGRFVIEDLGLKNAAVLYDIGNDYSVGLYENFCKAIRDGGGTIVSEESYSTGDKDFNAQLTKIKNANPEVVYLPDYYSTVALIAKQLRAQGINTPIVGADGWDGVVSEAGDEMLNGYYSNHYAADSTDEKVINFVKAYEAKYGETPVSFAALGYDSMYMLRDALLTADVTDSASIRDALANVKGSYVTGELYFDENRNPVKSAVIVEIVKNADGELTPVYKTTINP